MRQEPIFALARAGFQALFNLADSGDQQFVSSKREEIAKHSGKEGGISVGIHLRRGDKHPWEFQYSKDYLPLTRYMEGVEHVLAVSHNHLGGKEEKEHDEAKNRPSVASMLGVSRTSVSQLAQTRASRIAQAQGSEESSEQHVAMKLLLASDDPDVYSMPEVAHIARAQDRIMLASKTALEQANGDKPKNKYIDEIHGWEGGFFRNVFWGLGQDNNAAVASNLDDPSEATLALRALVGRAYLLDLAVLAESDAVVCGVSAMGCRLLAVMMGWKKAVVESRWENVDGPASFDWTGIVW